MKVSSESGIRTQINNIMRLKTVWRNEKEPNQDKPKDNMSSGSTSGYSSKHPKIVLKSTS